MKIFSLYSNYLFPQNKVVVVSESERKRERDIKESGAMSTGARTRGQKRQRGARELGGDREVRRYLFHSYFAEIEFE